MTESKAPEAPPYRDPILTLGAADPIVPELAQLLAELGFDPGPVGTDDVSEQLLAAVNAFRVDHDIAEDRDGLPAETDPSSCIGPVTWAALRGQVPDVGIVAPQSVDLATSGWLAPRRRRRRKPSPA